MSRIKLFLAASVLSLGVTHTANATPVDIGFVVDQSLSMDGEFNFIPGAISDIDTALQSEGVVSSTRYGLAGYMEEAGSESAGLAFEDLTSSIGTVSDAATTAAGNLFCCTERGYHAADWGRGGFSWADGAVKVMILMTDEAGNQGSTIPDAGEGTDEENLGKLLSDDGILLNVVTYQNLFNDWDQAVYTDGGFQGLFDIDFLRTDPDGFTSQFVDAKVGEITQQIPVGPTTSLLALGLGILGAFVRRNSRA